MVQLSHLYITTGKTIALTRRTFVSKVMSLLFNMLSRFVIAFLPRSKYVLICLPKDVLGLCFLIPEPWLSVLRRGHVLPSPCTLKLPPGLQSSGRRGVGPVDYCTSLGVTSRLLSRDGCE